MTFDALTLAAIRDELERSIVGGRVQRVLLTGPLTIGLEVYAQHRPWYLLCSAAPEAARVCLTQARPVRDAASLSPFLLLLRKYVRDGRLVGVDQPPYERILIIRVAKRSQEGVPDEIGLIIEVMGRRSNAILVDARGNVLDALRRVGPDRNPRRPVLPGRPYAPPPAQLRLDPCLTDSWAALQTVAASAPERPVEELLAEHLAGFSPLAAREVAYRATGRLGTPAAQADWQTVRETVAELLAPLATHCWQPMLYRREGRVIAFAAYPLHHLVDADAEPVASISEAVETAFASGEAPPVSPEQRELLAAIEQLIDETARKEAALRRALDEARQAASLQRAGEAILASLTALEPGQTTLEFDGQQIALDPRLSPLENAQRYFREYRKARDAARQVPALLEGTQFRARQLAELRVLAELANTPARLRAVREELRELRTPPGQPASPSARGKRPAPRAEGQVQRARTPDGLEVLLGVSSRGNDQVTFKLAAPDDLWLHARGVPGAHVILRTGGREPSADSLLYAARLAARNSQARHAARVEVDVTPRKLVRRIPGAPPGLVTYRGERTILVPLVE